MPTKLIRISEETHTKLEKYCGETKMMGRIADEAIAKYLKSKER